MRRPDDFNGKEKHEARFNFQRAGWAGGECIRQGKMSEHRIQHVIVLGVMLLMVGTTSAQTDFTLNEELEVTMATVRTLKPSMVRFSAAKQLAQLTRKASPTSVSDSTVNDLISLLDDSDDEVRLWAAAALGNLGRRAKVAAPRLLALLPEADCLDGDWTSAATIRPALKRMGVKPPPAPSYNDCHGPR